MCAECGVPRDRASRDPQLLPVRHVRLLRDTPPGDGVQRILCGGHVLPTSAVHQLRVYPHLVCRRQQIQWNQRSVRLSLLTEVKMSMQLKSHRP